MEANVAELRDVAAHASELRDRVTALEATQVSFGLAPFAVVAVDGDD